MINKLKSDNFWIGIIQALVSLTITYVLLFYLNEMLVNNLFHHDYLTPPKLQVLILFFNLLYFRIVMVNWKKHETGKGILMVLTISVLIYVFYTKVHL